MNVGVAGAAIRAVVERVWPKPIRLDEGSPLAVRECKLRLQAAADGELPPLPGRAFWMLGQDVAQMTRRRPRVYGRFEGDRLLVEIHGVGMESNHSARFEGRLLSDGPGSRLIGKIEPVPPRSFVAFWFGFLGMVALFLTAAAVIRLGSGSIYTEPNGLLLAFGMIGVMMAFGAIGFARWYVSWERLALELADWLTATVLPEPG